MTFGGNSHDKFCPTAIIPFEVAITIAIKYSVGTFKQEVFSPKNTLCVLCRNVFFYVLTPATLLKIK